MPDIVIAGATFRNVPQIDIPKEGSGTASFVYEDGTKQITQNGTGIDVSGYAAVDVAVPSSLPVIQSLSVTQNGEYTAPSGVDGYSPVTVNVSGGGGASNVVTGTFVGGAATVDVPYIGTGYPIITVIEVDGGVCAQDTTWYNLVSRYAVGLALIAKLNPASEPLYDGISKECNNGAVMCTYKSSASDNTAFNRTGGMPASTYYGENATRGTASFFKWKSNTKMSLVTNGTSSGQYGFANGFTYRYWVVYSS